MLKIKRKHKKKSETIRMRFLPPQPITIGPAYDKLWRWMPPFESAFTRIIELFRVSVCGDMCSA